MPEETPSNIQYSLLLRSDKEATIIKMEDKCYTSTPFIDSISQDNLETSSDKKFQIEVQMISTPGNHEMQPLKMGSCRRYIRKMRPKKYTETKLFNPNNIISEEDIEAERKKREATTINMKKPFVITKVPREVPTEDFQVPQNIDIALLIEE